MTRRHWLATFSTSALAQTGVWPEGKRAALSLSFDDARPSQIDTGLALFRQLKLPATWYVLPGNLQKQVTGWREMLALGNQEIGNHSSTHPCTANYRIGDRALEEMTLADMAANLDRASDAIRSITGVTPRSFAYPCGQKFVGRGARAASYIPLVAERFTSGRGYLDEMGNLPLRCDFAQLLAFGCDDLSFSAMRTLLEKARDSGRWVIFAGHEIGARKFQTTDTEALRELADWLLDPANGYWIDTVGNVTRHLRARRGEL
ncbi:MAG: polysaccharide deacetylase family protein [Bryobacter sp.]|nr:polysaccharide deacetylase family protein [Bryobacter sp.]